MSSLPKRASTASIAAFAPLAVEISPRNAVKFELLNSDCSIFRARPTTVAPASSSTCVTETPSPPLAPVTSATLSFIASPVYPHWILLHVKGNGDQDAIPLLL